MAASKNCNSYYAKAVHIKSIFCSWILIFAENGDRFVQSFNTGDALLAYILNSVVFIHQTTPKGVKLSLKPLQRSEIPLFQGVKWRTARKRVVFCLTPFERIKFHSFWVGLGKLSLLWWSNTHISLFLEWFYKFWLFLRLKFSLIYI